MLLTTWSSKHPSSSSFVNSLQLGRNFVVDETWMHIEAPDVTLDRWASVELAIVEALVQWVLELTHLKLQLESYVSYRFLARLNASIIFIRVILKWLWHEIQLLILALNLRHVYLESLIRAVVLDLLEYVQAIRLVATLVALLVPLVLLV